MQKTSWQTFQQRAKKPAEYLGAIKTYRLRNAAENTAHCDSTLQLRHLYKCMRTCMCVCMHVNLFLFDYVRACTGASVYVFLSV